MLFKMHKNIHLSLCGLTKSLRMKKKKKSSYLIFLQQMLYYSRTLKICLNNWEIYWECDIDKKINTSTHIHFPCSLILIYYYTWANMT